MRRYRRGNDIVPVMHGFAEYDLSGEHVLERGTDFSFGLVYFVGNFSHHLQSLFCHGASGPSARIGSGIKRRYAPGSRYLGEEPMLDVVTDELGSVVSCADSEIDHVAGRVVDGVRNDYVVSECRHTFGILGSVPFRTAARQVLPAVRRDDVVGKFRDTLGDGAQRTSEGLAHGLNRSVIVPHRLGCDKMPSVTFIKRAEEVHLRFANLYWSFFSSSMQPHKNQLQRYGSPPVIQY